MYDQNLVEMAKNKLLSQGYGMYDLIEKMLPEKDLLLDKPRLLKETIASTLGIDIEKIRQHTFYSWLYRYRKRQVCLKKRENESANTLLQDSLAISWKDFKPSEPVHEIHTDSPVLKNISY